ncbi:MAG: hypothetical protein ACREJQ_04625 [bacterium]
MSVTSAMKIVKEILGEPPDNFGPQALAKIHALEGTACHAAALDWLAHAHGWLPTYEPPAWPKEHGDERRWWNVLSLAIKGFQEFVTQYEVEPIGIEQESFSSAHGLVGHLDLFCTLKYKRHRVKGVVDLKFVAALLESHKLQVRTYGRLDGFKDAQLGLLFHGNRTTGAWRVEPVDLTVGLDDVAAVAHAARLWAWAEEKKCGTIIS